MKERRADAGNGQSRGNRWVVLFTTVAFPFMSTLDTNIVNVALPVLSDKLHVGSAAVAWVASVYLIGMAATILFFGRLGDLKGQTRVFQAGVLAFTVGSLCASLAPSFAFLLAARAVQSLGAAATLANSQAIIARTFSERERGRALGVNGAFVALGYLAGPALGGAIVSAAGWRYIFLVNLPVGAAVFVLGLLFYPKEKPRPGRLDVLGAVYFAGGIAAFFCATQQGQAIGFGSPFILGCFAFAALCFVLFYRRQKTADQPLLQLAVFQNRLFSVSIFCAFASYMAISCYNLVQPFYLQDLMRLSPARAGLYMTIFPLLVAVVSPLSGALADRTGAEKLTLLGLLLTFAGLLLMATLTARTGLAVMAAYVAVTAVGNGMFQSPNNALVMASLRPETFGIGGSVNALTRTVGQSAGIAFANALLYGAMSARLGRHVTDFSPGQGSAFAFGMHVAYLAAAGVCLTGLGVTAARVFRRRQ